MATIGTVDLTVKVDASRVQDVMQAIELYERLLLSYGHIWTDEETVVRANASLALERQNLAAEAP